MARSRLSDNADGSDAYDSVGHVLYESDPGNFSTLLYPTKCLLGIEENVTPMFDDVLGEHARASAKDLPKDCQRH